MQFVPKAKSRRRINKKTKIQLLPTDQKAKWKATFTGFSVEVTGDSENGIRSLYENGGFGKGSHSRSFPMSSVEGSSAQFTEAQYAEILVLDLEEAFFLTFILNIVDILDLDGVAISREQAYQKFQKIKPKFSYTLPAYLYLRSKGWIVKSGTKFGGDFLLYKLGTRYYHASFIVIVLPEENTLDPKDFQGMHRIAETSDKDILLLNVIAPKDVPFDLYHDFIHTFKVTETIPRRFDFKKHVQSR